MHGVRVFLAAPYSQFMDWEVGAVIPEWRSRFDSLRRDFIEAGAEVFSAHHNESWGSKWLPPEECTPSDFHAMAAADVVCAIVGSPPSGGVSVELGWASAMLKPVVVILSPTGGHTPLIDGLGAITRTAYLEDPCEWDAGFRRRVLDAVTGIRAAPHVGAPVPDRTCGYVGPLVGGV
jgi:nucleoside 2-deoxyribosyltransferase